MQRQELRAAMSLAAVFSVRMLGLFMIYPVFAAFARQLAGATPYKIGLALGIYGLRGKHTRWSTFLKAHSE